MPPLVSATGLTHALDEHKVFILPENLLLNFDQEVCACDGQNVPAPGGPAGPFFWGPGCYANLCSFLAENQLFFGDPDRILWRTGAYANSK